MIFLAIVSNRKHPEMDGTLELTGHLGDVMKESAQIALSYLRSLLSQLQFVGVLIGIVTVFAS